MASRLVRLKKLRANERLAITLLRGQPSLAADPERDREFTRLRKDALQLGFFIHAPHSMYAGADELELIAWLTALQRYGSDITDGLEEKLRKSLVECAAGLIQDSIRLNCSNLLRLPVQESYSAFANGMSKWPQAPQGRPFVRSGGTLQARVLTFVSERGVVPMRELNQFGASRQLISLMFKRGLLKRTAFGQYATAMDILIQ